MNNQEAQASALIPPLASVSVSVSMRTVRPLACQFLIRKNMNLAGNQSEPLSLSLSCDLLFMSMFITSVKA